MRTATTRQHGAIRALVAAVLALIGALALAPAASAQPGDLSFVECLIGELQDSSCATGGDPGIGLAASPDGSYLYVTGGAGNTLSVFERNRDGGGLRFVQRLLDDVGGVDGLQFAVGVAVSPDGRQVYVAAYEDDSIAAFDRDPATGKVEFRRLLRDGNVGINGLDGAAGVEVSPDGSHVFVAAHDDDAIVNLSRDPETGRLDFIESRRDGVGGVTGLQGARGVAVSPDGRHAYVASRFDNSIVSFEVSDAGRLLFRDVFKDGVGGIDGLSGTESIVVSPDGRNVYATGFQDDALVGFDRDPSTGSLRQVIVHKDGIGGVDALDGAAGVSISPDGRQVYLAAGIDDAIATFDRDPATGVVGLQSVARDGIGAVDGLDGANFVAISPDARHVYSTSVIDKALATFVREQEPTPVPQPSPQPEPHPTPEPTPGPTPEPTADRSVTDPALDAKKRQVVRGRRIVVELSATAGEAVDLLASGRISVGRSAKRKGGASRPIGLKTVRSAAAANQRQALRLKPTGRRPAKRVRRLLAKGRTPRAAITVVFTDRSGNSAVERRTVQLVGARRR